MAGERRSTLAEQFAALPNEITNQAQVTEALNLGMRLIEAGHLDEARECAQRIRYATFPFASTKQAEQTLSAHIAVAEQQAAESQGSPDEESQSSEEVLLGMLQGLETEFGQLRQIALDEASAASEVMTNLHRTLLSPDFRQHFEQLSDEERQRVLDARDRLVLLLEPERDKARTSQEKIQRPGKVLLEKIQLLEKELGRTDDYIISNILDQIMFDAMLQRQVISDEEVDALYAARDALRDTLDARKKDQKETETQPVRAELGSEWVVSYQKAKKEADEVINTLGAERNAIRNKIDALTASDDIATQRAEIVTEIQALEKSIESQQKAIQEANKKWNDLETIYSKQPPLSLDSAQKVETIRSDYEDDDTRKKLDAYTADASTSILKELQVRLAKKVLQLSYPEVGEIRKNLETLEFAEIEGESEKEKIQNAFSRITVWRDGIRTLTEKIQEVSQDTQVRKALQDEFVQPWLDKLDAQVTQAAEVWRDNYKQVYPSLVDASPGSFRGILSRLLNDADQAHKEQNTDLLEHLLTSLAVKYDEVKAEIFTNSSEDLAIPEDLKEKLAETLSEEWDKQISDARVKKESRESVVAQMRELYRTMQQIERTPAVAINLDTNAHVHKVDPVYRLFESIKARGVVSPEELRKLEKDILLFDYRYTKRVVEHKMSRDELNSSDADFYFKRPYETAIVSWGFGKLADVRYRLNELNVDGEYTQLLKDMGTPEGDGDLARFQREIGLRRLVFYGEQTLEPLIFGMGDIGKNAQRNFPEQTPEIFIDQSQLVDLIKGVSRITTNPELLFVGEKEEFHEVNRVYNRELPSLSGKVKKVDFENPGKHIESEFTPTARGETMRLLDLLYANKLHKVYAYAFRKKKEARARGTGPYADLTDEQFAETERSEKNFIRELNGYYRTMHISSNKGKIPERIQRASQMILDLPENEKLSQLEIKQTWIIHTLLCRQSELIPESSPALNDAIYKAEQWIAYLLQGSADVRTTAASYWSALMLFRTNDPNDPNGYFNVLDLIGRIDHASLDKLPKAHNAAQSMGHWLAMIKTTENSTSVYTKMQQALHHTYGHDFDYLLEPLAVVDRDKNHGIIPIVPTVMRYQLVSDEGNPNLGYELIGKNEKPVVRWKKQGYDTPPTVNLSDYVGYMDRYKYVDYWEEPELNNGVQVLDANGKPKVIRHEVIKDAAMQIYEDTPFEKVLAGTQITDYFNNGANIKKLYSLMTAAASDKLLDPQVLAGEQNDFKYAATFFPILGPEASVGRYNSKRVFNRITIKHVFGMCISLLASDTLDLHQLTPKLDDIAETIGQDAANAIKLVLEAGFGQSENAQRDLKALNKQINSFFNVQS